MASTVDLKNGLLGFSNPNYQLDDAVNCNTASDDGLYDELYEELDSVCNFKRGPSVKNRRSYANLDLNSMGIDLTAGPAMMSTTTISENANHSISSSSGNNNRNATLDTTDVDNSSRTPDNEKNTNLIHSNKELLDYYLNADEVTDNRRCRPDLLETADSKNTKNISYVGGVDINLPDSNIGGVHMTIPHVTAQVTSDLYALPVKRKAASSPHAPTDDKSDSTEQEDNAECLPPGWEKHEDADGPYYWHIKSGTIQRDPPPPPPPVLSKDAIQIPSNENNCNSPAITPPPPITSNSVSPSNSVDDVKRRSSPRSDSDSEKQPIRFAVRSLGWVEIAEEDLTPERSSKAVNKCIVDLSLGRNDILDVVGRWGDGKDLYMDLDDHSLKLIDPENLTGLNTQPIHTIRVWGVGRDNGRDFAYVARDRASRKHMCHVFRCDTPARTIANTLRDICKKIMLERSLSQNLGHSTETVAQQNVSRGGLARPTNLPTEHRRFHHRMSHMSYTAQSFPTPMEEPKKVLKVRYIGVLQVNQATGMEVLNHAIDHLISSVPVDQWQYVNVAVAPSTITISEQGDEGRQITECRVRYLSFLGIGQNVKQCAFVMHTAQDHFMAHVFHCEPSSGALCKTIEAACKLRYQKCLDAHRLSLDKNSLDSQNNRGLGAALKNILGSFTGRKARSTES